MTEDNMFTAPDDIRACVDFPSPDESVTISAEEYGTLKADSEFLWALLAAGVDAWPGFGNVLANLEKKNV
jgi:hypothetical protein